MSARGTSAVFAAAALAAIATGCGSSKPAGAPAPAPSQTDLSSTRSSPESLIDRSSVKSLHVLWRFRLGARSGAGGGLTGTPVVSHGVVYAQDGAGNVSALALRTGSLRWRHARTEGERGANGLTVVGPRVIASASTSVYALSAASGRVLWERPLLSRSESRVAAAPIAAHGLVYVSTLGHGTGRRGALYALAASTGRVVWKVSTVPAPYPPSLEGSDLYWGTDSLLVLDSRNGKQRWRGQVTGRGSDFQSTPLLGRAGSLPAVFVAGRAGFVIAWNRATQRRLWRAPVGDSVCPRAGGGVETPLAYADDTLFVPVVDLCSHGELVALAAKTGKRRWLRRFPQADLGCATVARGVVFTSTDDGSVYALDTRNGQTLWRAAARAGIESCPTLAGNELLVAAGVRRKATDVLELTAFGTKS